MAYDDPKTIVSTEWLKAHLKDPDLRILDGSWHMPSEERNGAQEFIEGHLPTARFFDIDDISDHRSNLPHMAPPLEKFMSRVRLLGVGDGHQIVVYDSKGLFSAARVWWLFRLMGHVNIAVLDGAGHIPGSKNLPFTQVLNADHTLKSTAELVEVFRIAGINLNKPAITTCGSGITAAILSLALELMGKTDHALYDGSWTEWGQFPTLNVATGDV